MDTVVTGRVVMDTVEKFPYLCHLSNRKKKIDMLHKSKVDFFLNLTLPINNGCRSFSQNIYEIASVPSKIKVLFRNSFFILQ